MFIQRAITVFSDSQHQGIGKKILITVFSDSQLQGIGKKDTESHATVGSL